MRSNKQLFLIINTFLIVLIMMSATPAQADSYETQAEQIENMQKLYPHYYEFPKKIAVVVDPTDPLVYSTAYSVYKSIIPIIGTTELVTVTTVAQLDELSKNNDYWVYIYFFSSDIKSVHIGSGTLSWSRFASIISQSSTFTDHIIGIGNSMRLRQYLGHPRFHIEGSDVIDANIAFLHALWALADIMEPKEEPYHSAGVDFRTLAIKYYFSNFDTIFERNMEPIDPLGEEDLVAKEENYQKLIDAQPAYIEPKIIHKNPDGTEDEYLLDDEGQPIGYEGEEELKPILSLMPTPPAESGLSDFIVGILPISSGMQGPIGGIVDTLLEFLIDEMGNQLGLDESTGALIADAMEMIELVVGIAKDPSPSSAIKGIIDLIKGQFPFLQEYDKYFDLIVDALFALRGEASDITGLITSALGLLLPDSLSDVIAPVMDILKMGPELIDALSGDKIFENLLTLFSGGMVETLLKMLMKEIAGSVPGLEESDAEDYAQKINSFIKCMISMISSFDPQKLITDYIPDIMTAFGLTIDTNVLQQVLGLVNFGFTALGMGTKTIKDVLQDYLQLLIGTLGAEDAVATAKNLVDKINNAISAKSTDISGFRTDIETILTAIPGISTGMKDFMIELLVMIGGFMNPEFPKGEIPALMTSLLPQALTLFGVESGVQDIITKSIKAVMGIIAFFKDNKSLKEMLYGSVNNFLSNLGDSPEEIIMTIIDFVMNSISIPSGVQAIIDGSIGIVTGVISLFTNQGEFSIQGILQTVLQAVGLGVFQYLESEIETAGGDPQALMASFTSLFNAIFPSASGGSSVDVNPAEVINQIMTALAPVFGLPGFSIDESYIRTGLELLVNVREIFNDGIQWLFNQLMGWVEGKVTELLSSLSGAMSGLLDGGSDLFGYNGEFPIGIGSFSFFTLVLDLRLIPGFQIDGDALYDFIVDIIFHGLSAFKGLDAGGVFKKILSFFEIVPIFRASLEMNDFGSGKNSFMSFLLETLGLELSISGSAYFAMKLFSLKAGSLDTSEFLKVIEWGFKFSIQISKSFTLLDFLTGGVGGGLLNSLAELLGLDAITITIYFGVAIEVIMRAATATEPKRASMTIELTIGVALDIGINLYIVSISFHLALEIVLSFIQDLANPGPLKVLLSLTVYMTLSLTFLFIDKDFNFQWSPSGSPWDISPSPGSAEMKDEGLGFDKDDDGIGDEAEATYGTDPLSADTDGDLLSDKYEVKMSKTDPLNPDTDGDGLNDHFEIHTSKTNPKAPDTDYDGLTDYEEVIVYGTNPLASDTDADGLTDKFEVTKHWNLTGITPSVLEVIIGGVSYNDHTDPLNPDTDEDGLLDGQEGDGGINYGPELYNSSDPTWDSDPLFMNNGFTHPLDNDTDDDSYEQLWDGTISVRHRFLIDMTDGVEVFGQWVTFYDPETGEPYRELVRTNPTNPDSDGDTGIGPGDRDPCPEAEFINSDGYELSLNPPSDPNNGDSDYDGLLDGLEGTLRSNGNHTFYLDGDTDGDGLGDAQDLLLGTDPRHPDTDRDMVTDGDEYFKYGTNPLLPDTDFDGLTDGEELFIFHSNPFLRDSDGDGIDDGEEVFWYFTDPMDEDTDNDGLTDFEELFFYDTDPLDEDMDGDTLLDGDEIYIYKTDPRNWDTDADSITEPNENGEMTFRWGDGEEVAANITSPTSGDSDGDGISDGIELYLGSGLIPNFVPVYLNPASKDTDGDGMTDGTELHIRNISDIIFPYFSLVPFMPYNSSPALFDTDGDGLNDSYEIQVLGSNPASIDSDNDTLVDGDEVLIYLTSPTKEDTDGDGLLDIEEVSLFDVEMATGSLDLLINVTSYDTDPLDTDTDDDLLPDGAEVFLYVNVTLGGHAFDPLNDDVNSNGVIDGMEIDSDNDCLFDGEEFFIYNTVELQGGGIFNPDSDFDALMDGLEVFVYGTDPADSDTDDDGFSDGFEVLIGTDPLTFTTQEMIDAILATIQGPIILASPLNQTYNYTDVPILLVNVTTVSDITGRWASSQTNDWSSNFSLNYRGGSNWDKKGINFPKNSTVQLELTIEYANGSTYVANVWFSILPNATTLAEQPWYEDVPGGLPVVIGGGVVGAAGLATLATRFNWSNLRRRRGGSS